MGAPSTAAHLRIVVRIAHNKRKMAIKDKIYVKSMVQNKTVKSKSKILTLLRKTERLRLRPLGLKDVRSLVEIGNEKLLSSFTMYLPFPFGVKDAKKVILDGTEGLKERRMYRFGIELNEQKKIIGIIDIYDINGRDRKAKIGYWLGKEYRGRGFASEAVNNVLDLAFKKLSLNKVSAKTLKYNTKSNNILNKFKFKRVAVLRKDKNIDGKLTDTYIWELTKEDFSRDKPFGNK